jgi:hypothetical protein
MIINENQGAIDTGYDGSNQPIIQNLGPGDINFGSSNGNLLTNGLLLPAGGVYEYPATLIEGANKLWIQVIVGGVSADVRIINVG